ncbi:MAG TPA: hypothetical protein VL728_11670 [Cyclobacteriaceae bacterium]|nr:hypothetical protein [Cyclobacteriaceae bacterium]
MNRLQTDCQEKLTQLVIVYTLERQSVALSIASFDEIKCGDGRQNVLAMIPQGLDHSPLHTSEL